MPYDYASLYDVEKGSGVDFDLGWQGLSTAERQKVRDYYKTKYGPGWRRKFRLETKQPLRAAGNIGLDITPEKGDAYDAYEKDVVDLENRIKAQTGGNIRDFEIAALEQGEKAGMPGSVTENIGKYAATATNAANQISADAEKALSDWWREQNEMGAEAIAAEVLKEKAQTGKIIGEVGGGVIGGLTALIPGVGPLIAPGAIALGAKAGGAIGGGGNVDEYASTVEGNIDAMNTSTDELEELLKKLQEQFGSGNTSGSAGAGGGVPDYFMP